MLKRNKLLYKILLICILNLSFLNAKSQYLLSFNDDLGYNNIHKIYSSTSIAVSYNIEDFTSEIGASILYFDKKENILDGFFIGAGYNFRVNSKNLNIKLKYLNKIVSNEIREDDMMFIVNRRFTHFEVSGGFNNRFYRFKHKLNKQLSEENKGFIIYEPFNFMYLFKYHVNEENAKWDFSPAITNIDDFTVFQETNPMFYLEGTYKFSEKIDFYSQFWLKKGGMVHASANFFGCCLRFGIVWKLEK